MSNNQDLNRAKGNTAEKMACEYLKSNGYEIIKQNFTFGKIGEIDIIAEKNNVLVFIEVRSKHSNSTYDPIFSVNYPKQRSIRKSAEGYLYINKITNKECRIDVIIIDLSKQNSEINHIENAF